MSPTLTSKTFEPIVVMSLAIILIVALTPGIMLISIIIPYTSQLLKITGCILCGSFTATCSCVICSLRLVMPSYPSDWANLAWTPSLGQSSCSDSILWTAVMSWGYSTPISSYKKHIELCNYLWRPWKRQFLKCFWTLLMLNIVDYPCWTAFSAPSNYTNCHFLWLLSLLLIKI